MGGRLFNNDMVIAKFTTKYYHYSQKEDSAKKVELITSEVLNQLSAHCNCRFAQSTVVTNGVFSCFKTGSVHFRAQVHGTANATAAALIHYIQRWVNEGAVLTVDLLQLRVDTMCAVAIPSIAYNNDGCDEPPAMSPGEVPINTSKTLGLTEMLVTLILSGSIVLLMIVIIVVAFLAIKKHCNTRNEQCHGSVNAM